MAKLSLRQFLAKVYDRNARTKGRLWAVKSELEAPFRNLCAALEALGVGELAPKSPPFGLQPSRIPDIDPEAARHALELVSAITPEDLAGDPRKAHGITKLELRELHHGLVSAVGVPVAPGGDGNGTPESPES